MKDIVVESFTMDHTKVEAPFVRKCGQIITPKKDMITKFDLRFVQPNKTAIPTAALHGMEHLMAGFIRSEIADVVDISPMGCRTGFYLILIGDVTEDEVVKALINALEKVTMAEEIPAANPVQCGNYRDLSLFGAQEYAKDLLKAFKNKYQA
ncbi:S-ribosylhomocysteine lyase [Proteinivorax tanatarense]|uniref:S-ribosylhomocysteine lyase n=1 Tax=Proteinivorax tanatarense TaxID=1260629 RepID=A0AAU7VMA3_9FIRM